MDRRRSYVPVHERRSNGDLVLPSLTAVARQGWPLVGVDLDPLELLRRVAADFDPMNELCERAGLSERAIYERSKAVFEYFGFPYDAPPPG